jgi:hypothetical protein
MERELQAVGFVGHKGMETRMLQHVLGSMIRAACHGRFSLEVIDF